MKNRLILRADLTDEESKQFLKIKDHLGIKSRADVIRYLIKHFPDDPKGAS